LASFVQAHELRSLPLPILPSHHTPDFVWEATEALQTAARRLVSYRNTQVTRNLLVRVGPQPLLFPGTSHFDVTFNAPYTSFDDWVQLMSVGDDFASFKFTISDYLLQRIAPGMRDIRIVALAPQWITMYPGAKFATPLDDSIVTRQNALLAYERRIRVPTIVAPPIHSAGVPNEPIFVPLAATTDEDPEQLAAISDERLAGRLVVGEWTISAGRPVRRGHGRLSRFQSKDEVLPGQPEGLYPSLLGFALHLKVSGSLDIPGAATSNKT
jgi:hypothetical protein